VTVGIDPGGDYNGHVHDPAALTHLLGECVHPDVCVGTGIERTIPERADRLVQRLCQV
jgi:hypothetical protein